jgi:hypothetical protein
MATFSYNEGFILAAMFSSLTSPWTWRLVIVDGVHLHLGVLSTLGHLVVFLAEGPTQINECDYLINNFYLPH